MKHTFCTVLRVAACLAAFVPASLALADTSTSYQLLPTFPNEATANTVTSTNYQAEDAGVHWYAYPGTSQSFQLLHPTMVPSSASSATAEQSSSSSVPAQSGGGHRGRRSSSSSSSSSVPVSPRPPPQTIPTPGASSSASGAPSGEPTTVPAPSSSPTTTLHGAPTEPIQEEGSEPSASVDHGEITWPTARGDVIFWLNPLFPVKVVIPLPSASRLSMALMTGLSRGMHTMQSVIQKMMPAMWGVLAAVEWVIPWIVWLIIILSIAIGIGLKERRRMRKRNRKRSRSKNRTRRRSRH